MPAARKLERVIAFSQRHPWWWLLAYLLVTAALYQLALRAPLYQPFIVEPSALDRLIPVVPWTAGPYLTYFLLMPSWVWLVRHHPERGRWLMAAGLVVLGNLLINNLVPTELAEPLRSSEVAGTLLATIIEGDAPRAVIPSGHLALPLALAILSRRARVAHAWIYVPWAAMMAVVILTTHQHYVIDALGALVWGGLAPLLTMRLCRLGGAR